LWLPKAHCHWQLAFSFVGPWISVMPAELEQAAAAAALAVQE